MGKIFCGIIFLFVETVVYSKATTTLTCEPLFKPKHMKLECFHPVSNSSVNCAERALVGTTVKFSCGIPTPVEDEILNIKCDQAGKWTDFESFASFKCKYFGNLDTSVGNDICGAVVYPVNQLLRRPWHAAILRQDSSARETSKRNPSAQGPFKLVCGGTLIKDPSGGHLVITARSCVVNAHGKVIPPAAFKVAMGFISFDSESKLEIQEYHDAQHFTIGSIVVSLNSDLALLELNEKVNPKIYVHPICLDMNQNRTSASVENSYGQLVGFTDLKYLCEDQFIEFICESFPDTICCKLTTYYQSVRRGLKVHNSNDCAHAQKFSAGYDHELNSTESEKEFEWDRLYGDEKSNRFCALDVGGGLAFPQMNDKTAAKSETYFLQGVLTDQIDQCVNSATFSNVHASLDWIASAMQQIRAKRINKSVLGKFIFKSKFNK